MALHWRYYIALISVFAFVAFIESQTTLLSKLATSYFQPSIFWSQAALVALLVKVFVQRGALGALFGSRLMLTLKEWHWLNTSFITLFISLALLAALFGFTAQVQTNNLTQQIWANYKLFVQPLLLLLWPPVAIAIFNKRSLNQKAH
ncbi:MAG: hypothetical protein CL811_05695 [Colwelliaceae bacterium]|nr:hypothetical protein [Colwelliaceae bacterium]